MNVKRIYIKQSIEMQHGFTLMEFLVALLISSIIFLGMCFVIVETSAINSYESIKLDSKVFANYVLDDIETSIVKGSSISISPGTYSGIDEITINNSENVNIIYSSHSEFGVSRAGKKIYNYDNTYNNGQAKYNVSELKCYRPTSDNINPTNPASLDILNSSYIIELKIDIFDAAGDELESYYVDRYVFNPYIYSNQI